MASLSEHHSGKLAKLMYIGDSGTGKTGSLTSLVAAGYKLRILDMDNGLDVLAQFVRKECPDKINNVDYETRRDAYRIGPSGPVVSGTPKAFLDSLKLLTEWSDGTKPSDWGEDTFLVIDSLSAMGRAAFAWARGLNPSAKDPRQWYFSAQQALEDMIMLLTSEAFATNVVIISHVSYQELHDGSTKGYANAIGRAMGPVIPKYFNSLLLAESIGQGKNVKRRIKTVPTGVIDLKTPAPFKIDAEYPLETGLAAIVKELKNLN